MMIGLYLSDFLPGSKLHSVAKYILFDIFVSTILRWSQEDRCELVSFLQAFFLSFCNLKFSIHPLKLFPLKQEIIGFSD